MASAQLDKVSKALEALLAKNQVGISNPKVVSILNDLVRVQRILQSTPRRVNIPKLEQAMKKVNESISTPD